MFASEIITTHRRSAPRLSHAVWPLPSLNGRSPVVCASRSKLPGVDLAYARAHEGELIEQFPLGTHGSTTHFMPSSTPAFCVADGVIQYASKQAFGHAVIVNHNNGWATYYTGLEHMFARATVVRSRHSPERVKAGDVLGYVGSTHRDDMKALHFELWKLDEEHHYEPVGDTLHYLRNCVVLPWSDTRVTSTEPNPGQIAA